MPIFEEKQYFWETFFVWVIDLGFIAALLGILSVVLMEEGGSTTEKMVILLPYLVILPAVSIGMRYINFRVTVAPDGLTYRFLPFQLKDTLLAWSEIKSAEVVTYKPLMEYGGWGIRWNFSTRTRAFTVRGNRGVLLELADGKRLLLGSQQAEALQSAIQQAKSA